MAKVEDCPGFETFGADVKAAREAKRLARKTLAEMVGIEWRYLAGASTLARNKNYYKPQKCGLFYVKFYLFLCCTELYFIFICDIMRYETQL